MQTHIPKVIHFCWFGHNPLPSSVKACIQSWKKRCPDYRIVGWNENNFDISRCAYMQEAYEAGRWAFVSDVARLFIIYEHGGIYLDTDVELLRSLDSVIQTNQFFFGIETHTSKREHTVSSAVNTGLGFGAVKKHPTVKAMLDMYTEIHFSQNGVLDMTCCPQRNSAALRAYGFTGEDRLYQFLGGSIYPSEYFCPREFETDATHFSRKTVSIHHFHDSWQTPEEKYYDRKLAAFRNHLPGFLSYQLASFLTAVKYHGFIQGTLSRLSALKNRLKQK